MRALGSILCALLLLGLPARADEERLATVVGTVEHLGHGTPAGITVHRLGGTELMESSGAKADERVVRAFETAATGEFEIDGLPPGVYVLIARRGATLSGDALVRVFRGSRREANVSLGPTRTLRGIVRFDDGRPVRGTATFRLRRNRGRTGNGPYDPWWDAEPIPPDGPTFDAPLQNGSFEIGLTSRPTDIRIETPEGISLVGEAWRPTTAPVTWTVPVPRGRVSGHVLDAAGSPVAGADVGYLVRLANGPRLATTAKAGPDGRFTLSVVSVPAAISASAEGYGGAREPAFAGGDVVLARRLTGVVEGVVVSESVPVAGAVVHVVPGERRSRWESPRHAVSGADGRYRVEDVPIGKAAVFVRGGGFASVDLAGVRDRGANPFLISVEGGVVARRRLPVEPAAKLSGRVLDHEGVPVVGATILAVGQIAVRGGAPGFAHRNAKLVHVGPFPATADAEGRFQLVDLVSGHVLSMRIDAPGKPSFVALARPTVEGASTELRFERPRYLSVHVVRKEMGAPVPDAWVSFEGSVARKETGPDGRVRFGPFGDGAISLRVRSEHLVSVVGVEVEGSEDSAGPFHVQVALERGLTISGRVVDADGTPVKGAHLRARHASDPGGWRGAGAVSDADGRFVLAGLFPGTWTLHASYPSSRERKAVRLVAEAGAVDVSIRFEPEVAPRAAGLSVRVVDSDGRLVPRARAQLVGLGPRTLRAAVRDGQASLDTAVVDPALLRRGDVFLVVTNARTADREPLPLGPGVAGPLTVTAGPVTVVLPPERRITGRVVSPDGEPIRGARVFAHRPLPGREGTYDRQYLDAGRTDGEGRFTVRYLGVGVHAVQVDAGQAFLIARTEAEAGRDVEIRLSRAATARVVVLGPDGSPLQGATLRIGTSTRDRKTQRDEGRHAGPPFLWGARRPRQHYEAAPDGSVAFEDLAPGRIYDLEIHSRRDDVQDKRLTDWTPVSGEIRLARGIVICGRVVDEEGNVVKDGIVAIDGPGRWSGKHCGEDGTFRFTRLEPGTYTLRVGRRGMNWDDPRIRERVVKESAEDLVVEAPPR